MLLQQLSCGIQLNQLQLLHIQPLALTLTSLHHGYYPDPSACTTPTHLPC